MNPDITEPAATIAPAVGEPEAQPIPKYRDFDIHEDPLHPPGGHRFLDYTKYGKKNETNSRKVPTIKRMKEPRKPNESLSGTSTKSVTDMLSAAPTQSNDNSSKEENMSFVTPVMQVQYSNVGGIGVVLKGKDGKESDPLLSLTLTTKPLMINKEYEEMFKSIPNTEADYKNLQQNLNDLLLQASEFIFTNDDVMTVEKNEAIVAMQQQFKDVTATNQQKINSVLQNIAAKITTPFPKTGDFWLKMTTSSFFPVKDGKNADLDPEILAIKNNPKFKDDPNIKRQIAIIEDNLKPKPNPNPTPLLPFLPAKNLHKISYRFTDDVPQEIQDLAKGNPFFNPAPPGSLVSVNFSYIYTSYQDKFNVKLCPNNINIYYYNTISMYSGMYEQRPQPGFKPMKQTIPQQIANTPAAAAEPEVPQTNALPEPPNKWRRQDGGTDVHHAAEPTAIAVTTVSVQETNNNNNNQANDEFEGFDDNVLNGLV